jgi:inosine-uridine nucleoside N-ribohydrolase
MSIRSVFFALTVSAAIVCIASSEATDLETQTPVRVIIDCDPGIDDVVALLWALAASHRGKLHVAAITTVAGNTQSTQVFQNAVALINAFKPAGFQTRFAKDAGDMDLPSDDFFGSDGMQGLNSFLIKEAQLRWGTCDPNAIADVYHHAEGSVDVIIDEVSRQLKLLSFLFLLPF